VPCHTMSPHGLIPPPIKRARTLVSCVVVTVIWVKFIVAGKRVAATLVAAALPCRKIPVSRHPPTRAKSGPVRSQQNRPSSPYGKKCPLLAFPLPESSFLKLFCALPIARSEIGVLSIYSFKQYRKFNICQ
jgi:hypothetical protein